MIPRREEETTAFGWSLEDYGPDYAGIRSGGKEVGGLRRDSEVRAGGPLVIIYSKDLEGSVEAVTAAGGTILKPIYAFPAGADSTSLNRPATSFPSGRNSRRPPHRTRHARPRPNP